MYGVLLMFHRFLTEIIFDEAGHTGSAPTISDVISKSISINAYVMLIYILLVDKFIAVLNILIYLFYFDYLVI
jgi:hypothetical protein